MRMVAFWALTGGALAVVIAIAWPGLAVTILVWMILLNTAIVIGSRG